MYPFEVWDERTQRVEFYFDRWRSFIDDKYASYPATPEHARIETTLYFGSENLHDVFVHDWNPHHEIGNTHLSVYDCFYDSSNWSTIFDVYPAHALRDGRETWKIIIEEGHENPWGEPIRIMSTSSDIYDDTAHRFAYFRGKYWKLIGFLNVSYRIRSYWELFMDQLDFGPTEDVFIPAWNNWKPKQINTDWLREGF